MAEKCDSDVMPGEFLFERTTPLLADHVSPSVSTESIERQHSECGARNLDFTFDAEKVCSIKLTTTTTSASSTTVATTASSVSHESAATSTSALVTSNAETTTTAESTPEASSTGNNAPVTDSAAQEKVVFSGIAMLFVASGMLLL